MRNAIEQVKSSDRAALMETDFKAAFDFMSVNWIIKVLLKKGCSEQFVGWLRFLYEETDTFITCIINNQQQERLTDRRKNVKQGDYCYLWTHHHCNSAIRLINLGVSCFLLEHLILRNHPWRLAYQGPYLYYF